MAIKITPVLPTAAEIETAIRADGFTFSAKSPKGEMFYVVAYLAEDIGLTEDGEGDDYLVSLSVGIDPDGSDLIEADSDKTPEGAAKIALAFIEKISEM